MSSPPRGSIFKRGLKAPGFPLNECSLGAGMTKLIGPLKPLRARHTNKPPPSSPSSNRKAKGFHSPHAHCTRGLRCRRVRLECHQNLRDRFDEGIEPPQPMKAAGFRSPFSSARAALEGLSLGSIFQAGLAPGLHLHFHPERRIFHGEKSQSFFWHFAGLCPLTMRMETFATSRFNDLIARLFNRGGINSL